MTDYRVVIPAEDYNLVNFRQEELPGVAVINRSLRDFEPKIVFEWHLSVMLRFSDLIENGMPSKAEVAVVDAFGDLLDARFKGEEKEKPNALFLARITWNGTRELIYRVFDPKPADAFLQELISSKSHPREFDYRIDPDPEWKLAQWHLSAGENSPNQPPLRMPVSVTPAASASAEATADRGAPVAPPPGAAGR